MAVVWLVRHAQASFGEDDYDVLSPVGERQAGVLGRRLASLARVDRLVHGGLRRQAHTAELCLDAVTRARADGRPVEVEDARWDEYDHRELLAASLATEADQQAFAAELAEAPDRRRAFQARFEEAVTRWVEGADDGDYAEPYPAFRARVRAALDALVADLVRSETAVVVTSGGVIGAVVADHLGLDAAGWAALNRVIVNTSVTKLVAGRRGVTLVTVNDHAHLETEPRELLTYR